MDSPRELLDSILATIGPVSEAQAVGARQRLNSMRGTRESLGVLEQLAEQLASARHSPRPRTERKVLAVFAADHGVADPGIDMGAHSPTIVAVKHLAAGEAAVCAVARTAQVELVIIDSGVRGGDKHGLGAGVLDFRSCDGTGDIRVGPAMTPIDALACVQTGVALVFSIADDGLDVLALGQVSAGSQTVSGAVVAALTEMAPETLGPEDADAVRAGLSENLPDADNPLDVLAKLGGPDIGMMVGAILGAASISIPIVLDDHATSAAALIATLLAPACSGYLIASHSGSTAGHRRALEHMGLKPLFDLGLAHGEGTGAALAIPMVEAAARLLRDSD